MPSVDRNDWVKIYLPAFSLFFVSALAFLPHIHRLGYYRDDWNLIYAGLTQGPGKFIDIYSVDRPLIGYLFTWIFYPLFGNAALGWNISAYLIRLAGIFGFYWLLNSIWPRARAAAWTAALLFAVYPGFLEQPNGIQYQPHLLNMTLYIFSLALTVKAVQDRRAFAKTLLTVGACLLGLLSMLMMEYYIGLEGVRLALIGLALQSVALEKEPFLVRLREVFTRWTPYAAVFLAFLIWRVFIFQSQRAGTDVGAIFSAVGSSPVYETLRLVSELLKDFFEVAFLSWAVPPYQLLSAARLRDFITAAAIGIAASAVVFLAQSNKTGGRRAAPAGGPEPQAREMVLTGIAWVLLTSIPIILAGREVTFSASLDRFTFPGSMGSALILAGLLFYAGRGVFQKYIPLVLVSIAVMTHHVNTINYANQWDIARNFWWQLAWRAPALEKDTVLVSIISGVPLEEDYELWGPANMIYFPNPGSLGIQAEVLNPQSVQAILMGTASERVMRTIEVERDYANTLVLTLASLNSCLHALDGGRAELSGNEDYRIQLIAGRSDINRIRASGEVGLPPADVFGREPGHGWCYYYQKASLARQQGDWNEVVRLGDEARRLNLRPGDWIEWLPFLQGYAYTEAYDAADSILPIIKEAPYINNQVCKALLSEAGRPVEGTQIKAGNDYLLEKLCGIET